MRTGERALLSGADDRGPVCTLARMTITRTLTRSISTLAAVLALGGCCMTPTQATPTTEPVVAVPPATTAAPTAPAPAYAVGTPVLAAWHGGQFWFAGVVVGTEGDQIRVQYADGTSEQLPSASVTADHLGPGASIGAHQSGETDFLHATLVDRIGHAVRVQYDDGHQMWTSVGLVRVDSASGPPALGAWTPAPPVPGTTATGAQVLARFQGGDYLFSAVVIDPGPTGAMRVLYADGDGEETTPDRVFPDTLAVGASVEGRDRVAGAILAGTVVQRVESAVELRLADGSTRWFALSDIRMPVPTP